jgi:ribonuclease Z
VVYSGDTRPCSELVADGAGADLLIHEATHSDDMIDKARSDRHSTVGEAIDISVQMRAKYTILTHFSSRFEKMVPDVRAYGSRAANVACAVDGMHVELARLPLLPAISIRITDLLAKEYKEAIDED